jgi:drug/metabolite transporter (DMT)-like permease
VLSKSLLSTIEPVPLLFLQLLASCLLLLPVCHFLKRNLNFGRSLVPAILLGILNPGVSYTFSMLALERIPASVSSIFWATEPFVILLLAAVLLKERITVPIMAVIATGFAGAVLVTGAFSGEAGHLSDLTGAGLMATAIFLCAIYTVLSRKLTTEIDPLALVAVQQIAGLGWTAALLAFMSGMQSLHALGALPAREIAFAALTGLMYYAVAYWIYLTALKRVSAALAGASFNVIPVVAIVVAYAFLGEKLSLSQIGGVVLIFISGFMLVWLTSHSAETAPRRRGALR